MSKGAYVTLKLSLGPMPPLGTLLPRRTESEMRDERLMKLCECETYAYFFSDATTLNIVQEEQWSDAFDARRTESEMRDERLMKL